MFDREHRSRAVVRSLMIAAVLSAPGIPALAQGPAESMASAPACDDGGGPGATYARCALWLEGRSLLRGTDATRVTGIGLFWPASLAPNFRGDSALAYGYSYDRNRRRAAVLDITGVVLFGVATAVVSSYHCRRDPTLGICTNSDDNYVIAAVSLMGAGMVASFSSVYFVLRANRALGRALWWHNANFGR